MFAQATDSAGLLLVQGDFHYFAHTTLRDVEMTQTHLQEDCRGTGFERRGLDMSDWRGVLGFWRRMTSRLSGGLPAAAAAAAPAPAAGTSTRGSSPDDSR